MKKYTFNLINWRNKSFFFKSFQNAVFVVSMVPVVLSPSTPPSLLCPFISSVHFLPWLTEVEEQSRQKLESEEVGRAWSGCQGCWLAKWILRLFGHASAQSATKTVWFCAVQFSSKTQKRREKKFVNLTCFYFFLLLDSMTTKETDAWGRRCYEH